MNTYDELERLDEADGLVDGAADGKVVDGDLAENALRVNDEEAAERDALDDLIGERTDPGGGS